MRRREFIKALAGSATAWPLAVRAQQRERMRRIEVLLPATSDDPEFQARVGAFLQGRRPNTSWSSISRRPKRLALHATRRARPRR